MEMLVRTVDKINLESAEDNSLFLKRGDVVAIMPDGHPWSVREKTNPAWMIVSIPNMSVTEQQEWLEENYTRVNGDKVNRPGVVPTEGVRRRRRFDFASPALNGRESDEINDDKRPAPVVRVANKSRAQRDQLKQLKAGG